MLFPIVQGGLDERLRARSAADLVALDLPGYAIGGLSFGETREEMDRITAFTTGHLPADKPRYLMGVGTVRDLLAVIDRGIDMFDCVMPTRAGRHGLAYTRHGRINLRNARHAEDTRPLDEASACEASSAYSRAYLHHLVRSDEILGMMLLTWNNLAYYQDLMAGMRAAITEGRLDAFCEETRAGWARAERDAAG